MRRTMRFATLSSALVFLVIGSNGTLCAPLTDEKPKPIPEGVLALMSGHHEGDIILLETEGRSGTERAPKPWPGGIIPYEVDSKLAAETNFSAVRAAMDAIEKGTCLRFVERIIEWNYIYLRPGEGCYSFVGQVGGGQVVSLGRGCLYTTTVAHELLHAAGFNHEHTRPDRDKYINVIMKNVIPEFKNQFEKRTWKSEAVLSPFDIDSIMLYGSDAFARDRSHPTILTKEGKHILGVYEKPGLSARDLERINVLYECEKRR